MRKKKKKKTTIQLRSSGKEYSNFAKHPANLVSLYKVARDLRTQFDSALREYEGDLIGLVNILKIGSHKDIYIERTLKENLFDYQIDGFRQLWSFVVGNAPKAPCGVLLAYGMGLGKTATT